MAYLLESPEADRSEEIYQRVIAELEKGLEVSVAHLADLSDASPDNILGNVDTYNLRLFEEGHRSRIRIRWAPGDDGIYRSHWRLAPCRSRLNRFVDHLVEA